MPELAEIKIMSEFLNREFGHRDVVRVEKSPLSKNKCDLSPLDGKRWKVTTLSRGKEMMMKFTHGDETLSMKIGFARIGCVEWYPLDAIDYQVFDKRAILRFYTEDRVYFISDFTRYVIFRWSDEWDTRRSPDILTEHNEWRKFLYHKRKIPYFKRPIFELIGDQRFFNGLGTFSKSEILARTRFSPFMNFNEILENEILREDFFQTCKETLYEIVLFGGLQFRFWQNPFGVSKNRMNRWSRVYEKIRKSFFLVDKSGKKFWFERKWSHDYIKWADANDIQDTRLRKRIYRQTHKPRKKI